MKPVITLRIGQQDVAVSDLHLMLELSACGRGFITVQTDADCSGQVVRLDMGYNNNVYRWFTGFVERCQPAENGSQRLFVREMVGIFERAWPISQQHPTLRTVTDELAKNAGLAFVLPAAGYVDTPVPHFTHSAAGYQILNNLGRIFGITDYVWFQFPDGTIYTGSYADSRFAASPVDIPDEFIKTAAAGNTWTLAGIPAIRPGVIVNGRRITTVRIENDTMTLGWTPTDSQGRPAQKSPEQRQIDKYYPELAAGLHVPRLARVISPTDTATLGDQADPFRPRYAVNLQLLDENGQPAAGTPIYPAVPLPVPMASAEGGMYQFPPEGTLVEVGFADGRQDKPIIRQTLQTDLALPDIKPGEQLQQQRHGVSQRVTQDGSWQRETDQVISEESRSRVVTADAEQRTVTRRDTTVNANDTTTVLGTKKLLAGAVVNIVDGDYTTGTTGSMISRVTKNREEFTGQNINAEVIGALTEKIVGIRRSVAAAQELIAPSVRLGSDELNVLTLLTDTLDVIRQLADLTAEHTHPDTGQPTNAADIAGVSQQTQTLNNKYSPFIAR